MTDDQAMYLFLVESRNQLEKEKHLTEQYQETLVTLKTQIHMLSNRFSTPEYLKHLFIPGVKKHEYRPHIKIKHKLGRAKNSYANSHGRAIIESGSSEHVGETDESATR